MYGVIGLFFFFLFSLIFIFLLLFSVDTKAEKRRKSEEVDPMDPAAYSDAPRYFFALESRLNASTLTIIISIVSFLTFFFDC